MRRHFRMSLVLVALCLALVCIFAGCNDELEAKVDKNATDAAAAVDAAAEKALADLNAAKAELNKLITDGDTASSSALATKVEELNAAIAAAKKAATDADAALKTELNTAIAAAQAAAEKTASDNLAAAKAELKTAIDANAADLSDAIEDLTAAIAAAKTVAADDNAALKEELTAAIELAAETAQANLEATEAALNAAISAQGEELTKALGDFALAIEDAKKVADEANAALKAQIDEQATIALGILETNLYAAIEGVEIRLTESINTNDGKVEDYVTELKGLIETAEASAKLYTDETKTQIDEKATIALNTLRDNLETAIESVDLRLTEAIETNDDKVEEYYKELNTLIAANKTAAELYTDEAKAELDAKITAAIESAANTAQAKVDAAKTALEALIAVKADAAALTEAKNALDAEIVRVDGLINGLTEADKNNYDALKALIDANKAAIDAAVLAGMQIADWNDATTEIATKVYAQYVAKKAEYDVFTAIEGLYSEEQIATITGIHTEYYIRIMRAATVTAANEAYTAYANALGAIPSATDAIYNAIVALRADGVEVNDEEALRAVIDAIGVIYNTNNEDLIADMTSYKTPDGVEPAWEGDLTEECINDWTTVNGLLIQDEGEAIRDKIIAYLEGNTITADELDDLNALRTEYYDWIEKKTVADWTADECIYANSMTLEGYEVADWEDTLDTLTRAIGRAEFLQTYAADVEALNAKIDAQTAELATEGPKKQVLENINALQAEYDALVEKYFYDEYTTEADVENFDDIKTAEMNALHTDFAAKLAEFQNTVSDFVATIAVLKETEIDLFAYDEIAAAWDAYAPHASTFNASLDYVIYVNPEDENDILDAEEAVTLLRNADDAYKALQAEALANYNTVFAGIDGMTTANVTLYDAAAIEAVLAWYSNYGVVADGNITFANGDQGYVFSADLTVTEADYNAVLALQSAWETLDAAKKNEKADLEAAITALGTVTMNDKTAIEAAEVAYAAWLAGNSSYLPEGYTADQFAIDETSDLYVIDNYADLTDAREYWNGLNDTITQLVADIEALATIVDAADFATQNVDRATYASDIEALETRIADFVANNGDSDEGYITEAHYNKLAAGKLACNKYDIIADVNALTADTKGYDCNDAIDAIKANAIATIEDATTVDAMNEAYTDAETRINNIATAAADTAAAAERVNACTNLSAATVEALNKDLSDLLADYVDATVEGEPATNEAKNDAIADLAEVANTANVDAKLNATAETLLVEAADDVAAAADADAIAAIVELASAKIEGCATMATTYNTYAEANPDKVTEYDNSLTEMLNRMLAETDPAQVTAIAAQLDATLASK